MRFLILITGLWLTLASATFAESVKGVGYTVGPDWTEITIARDGTHAQVPKIFQLDGDRPRVVVDFEVGTLTIGVPNGHGHVVAFRHAQKGDKGLRMVFDLAPGTILAGQDVNAGTIRLMMKGASITPVAPTQVAGQLSPQTSRVFENTLPYPRLQPREVKTPKRRPVIVIDPGHGGKDPGSIGRKKGTHEKLITLKASKTLRDMLNATGRYEVIMTRSDDTYIAHDERLRIARAGGGDLFISIHADSTKGTTARGASVYTLADRAHGRSKKVVDSHNWIMDVDLSAQTDPVGDILVDLAQRKTFSQSEAFADDLVESLSKSTRLIGNSHRRAGYYVLLAPDVPAVLLELGFLSNPHDEKLLRTASHRKKLMKSVVSAINEYFDHQKS